MKVFKGQIADSEAERLVAEAGDLMPGDVIAVGLDRISSNELLDGYGILFDANTRLAHEAVMLWAAENEPDGWPTAAAVHRFARCYGVDLDTLAGLCGILAVKRGNGHYYCDSRRHPELVNRLSPTRFSRRALAAYGFYNTAAQMVQRSRAQVH